MGYDDVPTDEAIDLIRTLPRGSMWRAARDPLDAWSDERHRHADVIDAIARLPWVLAGADPAGAPRVTRPADAIARARDRQRAGRVARTIRETEWEEA